MGHVPMPEAIKVALPLPNSSHVSTDDSWVRSDEVVVQNYDGIGGHCKQLGQLSFPNANNQDDSGLPLMTLLKSRFVKPNNLRVGSQIDVDLKPTQGINTRFPADDHHHDLPPFNTQSFVQNLKYFSISNTTSDAAYVMNLTLNTCEKRNPVIGKWQHCATSLSDLVDYAFAALGSDGLYAVSPPSAPTAGIRHYQVERVSPLASEGKLLLCHRYGFPYAVFFCHQPAATTAFSVRLADQQSGYRLESLVMCHNNTSAWSPDYIGMKALGLHPGSAICHFLHSHDLVWYSTK